MMKIFITGGTGYIGSHLVSKLASQNHSVHVLYRNSEKLPEKFPNKVKYFRGDILNPQSIRNGMKGCQVVFHLAAYARVWSREKSTFRKINYDGTIYVMEAARELGVQKVIVCSTAGAFGPSGKDVPANENTLRTVGYFSEYEKWKDKADLKILNAYAAKIHTCIVHPTRVFGPGISSESNAVTKLIKQYIEGKFRFLPGTGKAYGNYVFIDDVVNGMILAMQKGKSGEKYILGGENLTYLQFFTMLGNLSGKKYKMFGVPAFLIIFISAFMLLLAKVFKIRPQLTPGWARKYLYDWKASTLKAEKALQYTRTSFQTGLRKTIDSIQKE